MKLRQSQASDIEQTRKAVRAAIVLLPLLGITNLLYQVPALNLKPPWKFAIWSYVTHFLTSFQGFFIALIYCFLNGEVSMRVSTINFIIYIKHYKSTPLSLSLCELPQLITFHRCALFYWKASLSTCPYAAIPSGRPSVPRCFPAPTTLHPTRRPQPVARHKMAKGGFQVSSELYLTHSHSPCGKLKLTCFFLFFSFILRCFPLPSHIHIRTHTQKRSLAHHAALEWSALQRRRHHRKSFTSASSIERQHLSPTASY